jgi:hypothetical protein
MHNVFQKKNNVLFEKEKRLKKKECDDKKTSHSINYATRGKNNVMLTGYFINPEITAHTEIILLSFH